VLYKPSEARKKQANMTGFISFVNAKYGLMIHSYDELYDWSIEKIPEFWVAIWEFGEVKASCEYNEVVDDLSKFPGAQWFSGAKLNFAENLLRYRDDRVAFIFKVSDAMSIFCRG
jgi:acetoacetyl-CoA synthetase